MHGQHAQRAARARHARRLGQHRERHGVLRALSAAAPAAAPGRRQRVQVSEGKVDQHAVDARLAQRQRARVRHQHAGPAPRRTRRLLCRRRRRGRAQGGLRARGLRGSRVER